MNRSDTRSTMTSLLAAPWHTHLLRLLILAALCAMPLVLNGHTLPITAARTTVLPGQQVQLPGVVDIADGNATLRLPNLPEKLPTIISPAGTNNAGGTNSGHQTQANPAGTGSIQAHKGWEVATGPGFGRGQRTAYEATFTSGTNSAHATVALFNSVRAADQQLARQIHSLSTAAEAAGGKLFTGRASTEPRADFWYFPAPAPTTQPATKPAAQPATKPATKPATQPASTVVWRDGGGVVYTVRGADPLAREIFTALSQP